MINGAKEGSNALKRRRKKMGKPNAPYRLFKNSGKSSGKKRSKRRDPLQKANKLLEEEGQKQILVLFGSAAIA